MHKPPPDQGATPLVSDEQAATAALRLREWLSETGAGALNPDVFALGITLAVHKMERGAPDFASVALSMSARLRAEPNRLRRLLRPWYEGACEMLADHDRTPPGVDGPAAVRDALRALGHDDGAPIPGRAPAAQPVQRRDRAQQPPPPDAPRRGAPDAPLRNAPAQPPPATRGASPAKAGPALGWEDALARAEAAASAPAQSPSDAAIAAPGAPDGVLPDDAPTSDRTRISAPTRRRKTRAFGFSDVVWGALFVPGVMFALTAFLVALSFPPLSWVTGLLPYQIRPLLLGASLLSVLWLISLALIFPPVWLAWRRGWQSWLWPIAAACLAMPLQVSLSALIVLRSPVHPDLMAELIAWSKFWAPITLGAGLSISFGSRLRGGSRRLFRRIGRRWDNAQGIRDDLR